MKTFCVRIYDVYAEIVVSAKSKTEALLKALKDPDFGEADAYRDEESITRIDEVEPED